MTRSEGVASPQGLSDNKFHVAVEGSGHGQAIVRNLKHFSATAAFIRDTLDRRLETVARWVWLALKLAVWWAFVFGCSSGPSSGCPPCEAC